MKPTQCKSCRFFHQDIVYKSDGRCLKDDAFTREWRCCDKLKTREDRKDATNLNYVRP